MSQKDQSAFVITRLLALLQTVDPQIQVLQDLVETMQSDPPGDRDGTVDAETWNSLRDTVRHFTEAKCAAETAMMRLT
jgi:hypothetical protein